MAQANFSLAGMRWNSLLHTEHRRKKSFVFQIDMVDQNAITTCRFARRAHQLEHREGNVAHTFGHSCLYTNQRLTESLPSGWSGLLRLSLCGFRLCEAIRFFLGSFFFLF